MCTPDGYVFSRDALIENLAAQKKANKRKLAAWEEQQDDSRRKVCLGLLVWRSTPRSSVPEHDEDEHGHPESTKSSRFLPLVRSAVQLAERAAVAEQTQLLAFDRQNHMGVSSASAASLSAAIREEAEALLADKRVVETDVAITQNKAKIKVRPALRL